MPPLSSVYTMTGPKKTLKGPPKEKLGITDVLAFVLAAFIHVLPITLIGIGIFVVLWIVLTLVL